MDSQFRSGTRQIKQFVLKKKEQAYILTQNKTGFNIHGQWYLFPEEAVYLFQLGLSKMVSAQDEVPFMKMYQAIYDCPEDIYNKFDVNYFYHSLRKQGCFLQRFNLQNKKKQISQVLGLAVNIQCCLKNFDKILFLLYKSVQDYSGKVNSELMLLAHPKDLVFLKEISQFQNLKKIVILENADFNVIEIV